LNSYALYIIFNHRELFIGKEKMKRALCLTFSVLLISCLALANSCSSGGDSAGSAGNNNNNNPQNPVCGNGTCETGESHNSCPEDCPAARFCTAVAITPESIKIFEGDTVRFTAECSWSDASSSDCTDDPGLAWGFTGDLVQDDLQNNLFAGKARGVSAQVKATYNDGANPAVLDTSTVEIFALTPLSAGASHTCAVTPQKGLKCWGRNNFGQLGDGSLTNRLIPTNVYGLAGMRSVSGGGGHTCALAATGKVKCWGYNEWGELGDGTTAERLTPVNVAGLAGEMIAVLAGGHGCALDASGGLKCWGRNNYGQLGDGTTIERHTPVEVIGLGSGVRSVSGGGTNSCAVSSAGGLKCWGYNFNGQLGDGTTVDKLAPVDVSGMSSGISAVSVGLAYACALTEAGGVKCWGYNYLGELGDGTSVSSNVPVEVSGLGSGVVAISAGNGHTCAVTSSGGVKCWGFNYYGELGDGSTANRYVPVNVSGLSSGVTAVSTGGGHTCALTDANSIKCWGYNKFGQLGDGTANNRKFPVNVVWP
jgi:alpha-tubulin suppressor-like RCC1 family protein